MAYVARVIRLVGIWWSGINISYDIGRDYEIHGTHIYTRIGESVQSHSRREFQKSLRIHPWKHNLLHYGVKRVQKIDGKIDGVLDVIRAPSRIKNEIQKTKKPPFRRFPLRFGGL